MALTLSWLIAYFKLDESSWDASDATGNWHTLTANWWATFAAWKLNNWASLDGINDYFSRATDLWLWASQQPYSFTLWIKPSVTIATQQVFWNLNDAEFDNYSYTEWYGGNLRHIRARQGVAADICQVAQAFTAGTWYFISSTYDGSNLSVSINWGSRTNLTSTGNWTSGWTNNFTLWAQVWWGLYFNGIIDEVAIYNRALTIGEEADNYNSGTPPAYIGTQGTGNFFNFF